MRKNRREAATARTLEIRRVVRLVLVLIVGTGLLGTALHTAIADTVFFPLSLALTACWLLGAWWSGGVSWAPRREEESRLRVHVVLPLIVGALMVVLFALGALIAVGIPGFADSAATITDRAHVAPVAALAVAVIAGAAEEVFFRGALYKALMSSTLRIPPPQPKDVGFLPWIRCTLLRREVWVTTLIYAVVTSSSNNLLLVFSAVVLGLVTALLRARTGGVVAPIITHAVWSVGMFFILPTVF